MVVSVLMKCSDNCPQLQCSMRRAAQNLISRMNERSVARVTEIIEMEKLTDYTSNPEYMSVWNQLMTVQNRFVEIMNDLSELPLLKIDGFGEVNVEHLRRHKHVTEQAFDMKMRVTAYWKIVLKRLVDSVALHLLFSLHNLVSKEMEMDIVNGLMGPYGGGIEKMLEESPSVFRPLLASARSSRETFRF